MHILAGVAVLAAMGVNPLDAADRGSSPAAAAVFWAGPVIGAFNLIPVLPLDGGNVVTSLLDRLLPGRARPIMAYVSVGATVTVLILCAVSTRWRGLVVFLGFLLVLQLQSLFDERARNAESPFDVAAAALRDGNEGRARKVLVNGLRRPSQSPVLPRSLDDDAIHRIVEVLPEPLPYGDPWNEYVLANLFVRVGRYEEAAGYAAGSYERQPRTLIAATVARAAGALGDEETAVAWLRAAAGIGTPPTVSPR